MSRYTPRTRFFSQTEGAFYWALRKAVAHRYLIFAKVRLLDICNVAPGYAYTPMNKISSKHVDFLLCEPQSFEPFAAIEVDGSSHERPDRMERDEFVNAFFERIGVPLLRIPAKRWFEADDILRRIESLTT